MMLRAIAPVLSVAPIRAMVDEKFTVLVENLPPSAPVTVRSLHHSDDQDEWEAYGHYISDLSGTVSVCKDLSFGGTYSGVEPMGLVWSMRPVPGSREGLRLRKKDMRGPLLVNIMVYSGHDGFTQRPPLASVLTERWYMAPGVQRVEVRERGVRGTLFLPPGPGPFPGLLDMWGGGGGLHEYRAALLASHGYAALALEYFKAGELGSADLENKYFETAFQIIKDHPQVHPDRVGIFGLSLGTSIALALAAYSKEIKPRACVCVGSSIVHGRRFSDNQNYLDRHMEKTRISENGEHIWRDVGLGIMSDSKNLIDCGRLNCPLLVVNGTDDQNWPSSEMADRMEEMMRAAGKDHFLTRLEYPGAGHLIEPPYAPHFRSTNFIAFDKTKLLVLWGGQSKPHAVAQEDSWRRILSFLQQHLCTRDQPRARL